MNPISADDSSQGVRAGGCTEPTNQPNLCSAVLGSGLYFIIATLVQTLSCLISVPRSNMNASCLSVQKYKTSSVQRYKEHFPTNAVSEFTTNPWQCWSPRLPFWTAFDYLVVGVRVEASGDPILETQTTLFSSFRMKLEGWPCQKLIFPRPVGRRRVQITLHFY